MKQQTILESGLSYTIFRKIFKDGSATASIIVFAIATFILGTLGFIFQLIQPHVVGS